MDKFGLRITLITSPILEPLVIVVIMVIGYIIATLLDTAHLDYQDYQDTLFFKRNN